MAIKAILFDKDGTLIDFHQTFNAAAAIVIRKICENDQTRIGKVSEALGFDMDVEAILDGSIMIAETSFDMAEVLKPILSFEETTQEFGSKLDRLFGEACDKTVQPLPGANEALKTLKMRGLKLGIATNDAEANAHSQMKIIGFHGYFTSISGSDSGHGQKPGAGMVTAFVKELGLKPDEVMMVGDSAHDLQAGRAAGAIACAVLTGPATRAELEPHGDVVLDAITQLPDLLSGDLF
jgi:phosphoglycolate phosphatase